MTIERKHVGKRLSGLVIHRTTGTAYISGQVADDPTADVSGQTQQVLP
jgi:enamine deaminase RidA (YjgF/YER057c/UK114 family)